MLFELEFGVFITVVGVVPPHSREREVEIKFEFEFDSDLDLVLRLILCEGTLWKNFSLIEISEWQLFEDELVLDFLDGFLVSKKCAK